MSPPKKTASSKTPVKAAAGAAQAASADPLAVAPAAIANAAATFASFTPTIEPYDDVKAAALVETFRPRLAAIAVERIVVARLDVDAAARSVLGVHAFVTQAPGVHAWFSSLHDAGQFDLANVDDLRSMGLIVLHAFREATAAGAFKSLALIPADLDEASARVEKEMQSVAEHNLADDPEQGPLLDYLRPGTSYLDRAHDLLGYVKIYEARPDVVAKDTKYKPTHVADARRLAGEIIAALGAAMNPAARTWSDLLQRAWTLLLKMYFEVQQTGAYLLRYDPQQNQRFPSLFAVGRPGSGRKRGGKPPAGSPPATGGEDTSGTGGSATGKASP